jgi:glycolate oxidase iron-sulfur subunit
MQTKLAPFIKDTPQGREAESILRACVHCGFCTATCPTYQLLGDELDGPRGRIYLMKQLLEGHEVTARTQLHLDRCLTCRSCETTCPSGVRYGHLVDIGRELVEERVPRPAPERWKRDFLRRFLLNRTLFGMALGLGRVMRPLLPASLAKSIPARRDPGPTPSARHARKMILLQGCVQPALSPSIDAALARVLDRASISLVTGDQPGCCGALPHHMNAHAEGLDYVRRMIDAWWPLVEQGAEAIVISASGCGAMVKEYGHLLREDSKYATKAARVSDLARDPIEVVEALWGELLPKAKKSGRRVAFHPPCTLQHGLKIRGRAEKLLRDLGFQLTPVADSHLCCGSAGTYSMLQPELSQRLKVNKVAAIEAGKPEIVASANIGCLTHIESGTTLPVVHWIELLDGCLEGRA